MGSLPLRSRLSKTPSPPKTRRKDGGSRLTQEELDSEYPGAKLYVTGGGGTVAVTADGDIVSLCVYPGNPVRGKQLMETAVKNGGKKLDSYRGNHRFYAKCGFEAVRWCELDENYAPKGWVKGRDEPEPVVFYKYTGATGRSEDFDDVKRSIPAGSDYEAARAARDKLI